jgi:hypothetical protein
MVHVSAQGVHFRISPLTQSSTGIMGASGYLVLPVDLERHLACSVLHRSCT